MTLPPERFVEGYCAKLKKSLYGTRDAGANFQRFVMDVLTFLGFAVGIFSPCLARHKERFYCYCITAMISLCLAVRLISDGSMKH